MSAYGLALLLVTFGGLTAAFDLALLIMTPALLRILNRLSPTQAPSAILVCRFAPVGLSFLLVALVALPAWLRYEPANTGESASVTLSALTLLALLPILQGFHRAARMYFKTRDRLRLWRRDSRDASKAVTPFEIVEVKSEVLTLGVGGYLRPTIYASADLMGSLDPEEFSAALLHEVSHANSRDPLRLLWMAACPDFLQVLGIDTAWRRAFSRACEFAADADARRGSPEVALDLASALLKVARLRAVGPLAFEGALDVAVSSAFLSRVDLQARVEALASPDDSSAPSSMFRPWMLVAAAMLLCGAGALVLPRVHEWIEGVGRLLS